MEWINPGSEAGIYFEGDLSVTTEPEVRGLYSGGSSDNPHAGYYNGFMESDLTDSHLDVDSEWPHAIL